MKYKELIEILNDLDKTKELVTEFVKNFVQNKDNNLEERFTLLIKSGLGNNDGQYHTPNGIDWGRTTLYDDLHIKKHENVNAECFLDKAESLMEDDNYNYPININKIKEYFCDNFLQSFDNYW